MSSDVAPLGAANQPTGFILVRSALTREQTESEVRQVLARIDPALPFFRVESLAESVRRSVGEERLLARLLGLFALLAAGLAGIGLYGVIAYSVAQRRREIGIRVALGAPAAAVIALVARQSFVLLLVGTAIGTVAGYGVARMLENRVFGVTPVDPTTYAAALAGFAVVAALASAIPARAATRIDAAITMKAE